MAFFSDGKNTIKPFIPLKWDQNLEEGSNLKNKKLCIVPKINLVKNIGFGESATHTKSKTWYSELENPELINIKHPKLITLNLSYDNWLQNNVLKIKHNLFKKKIKSYKIFKYKLIFKISKILYKIIEYVYRLKKPSKITC